MIRFRVSVGILIVIAALSVLAAVYVSGADTRLDRALSDCQSVSKADAPGAFEAARESWEAEYALLRFLMDREELDTADAALVEAHAALRAGDMDEFRQRCAWIEAYVDGLLQSELPLLGNIF